MPELNIMPSILAAHPGRLEEGCISAERAGGDRLHLDIMDGHFVPNLSFGPGVVAMAGQAGVTADQDPTERLLLIAPNEETASKLPSWARIEILRTGVDCERYIPGDKARARRKVGLPAAPRIIGCASPAQGMAPLLETVFHMGEEVHLALFGNGRPGDPERALIKRLNMEERVHVLGAWARPETIFQAIDVYFHGPSGNSLPRPVLAAQACGKPAIACVPALSDALCPQTGRLAPLQFMPTLRHSLRCALDSAAPEVTRRFIVDNWNVEQSLEGYGALFKRLTERTCPNSGRA